MEKILYKGKMKMEYEFKGMPSFVPTGSLKGDLYRAIKNELGLYMDEYYHYKMEKLGDFYNDFNYDKYEREVQLFSRLSDAFRDSHNMTMQEYQVYFNSSYNKSYFSHSYVRETELMLRCLVKFDTYISRLALDIMVKYESFTNMEPEPFVALSLYFSNANRPVFDSFQAFLDVCTNFVSEVVR